MNIETMTSRERVVRTLNHQPADRAPLDLGMHPSTGISAFAYHHLRRHLGLDTRAIRVPDVVQMLAFVDEDVRQRFHLDCVMLEPAWPTPARWTPRGDFSFLVPAAFQPQRDAAGDWIVRQGAGQMRMPGDGFFFDGDWLSNWGGLDEDAAIALYAREAERVYKETPYATAFLGYGYGPAFAAFFNGLEHGMQMLDDPAAAHADNERRLQHSLAIAGKVIDAMGPHIQMLCLGNDMGMQAGPMCRPETMAEFVFPYYQRFCDFVHRHSDIKVFLHCCGSIKPLIPLIIEAGIDVLNPVQISAADMEPAALKREFGERIVFWGGCCNTQNVLGTAAPEAVARHTRGLVKTFKSGGGVVVNQVHNIMGDVPPANIVAMLDAAYAGSFP